MVDSDELFEKLIDASNFFTLGEMDLVPGEYEILDDVEQYFSEGGDPNALSAEAYSFIHLAYFPDLLIAFLNAGVPPVSDECGFKPIVNLAKFGFELVPLYFSLIPEYKILTDERNLAMVIRHFMETDNIDAMEYFLKLGFDTNKLLKIGRTKLHCLELIKSKEMMVLLLNNKADINTRINGVSLLWHCRVNEYLVAFDLLLSNDKIDFSQSIENKSFKALSGINLFAESNILTLSDVVIQDSAALDLCLQKGISLDLNTNTIFKYMKYAANLNKEEKITVDSVLSSLKLYFDNGYDSKIDTTQIHYDFIEDDDDEYDQGYNLLIYAFDPEIIDLFHENGVALNYTTESGESSFHFLWKTSYGTSISYLLRIKDMFTKFNPFSKKHTGEYWKDILEKDNQKHVQIFINAGLNPNEIIDLGDNKFTCPLELAKSSKVRNVLFSEGANPNLKINQVPLFFHCKDKVLQRSLIFHNVNFDEKYDGESIYEFLNEHVDLSEAFQRKI
eukprot:gene5649-9465_t